MMTGKRITNSLMVAVVAMGIVGLTVGTAQAADIIPSSESGRGN